jgi:hypothetical protein
MADEDFVTLLCPPGAEQGPVSFGEVGYRAYPFDPRAAATPWLVDVPREIAGHFLRTGGFRIWDPAAPR